MVSALYTVSIHALARSATLRHDALLLACVVSIHALARSATGPEPGSGIYTLRFNPRAREERDASASGELARAAGFNPRAREERDFLAVDYFVPLVPVSIHALARSATLAEVEHQVAGLVSIHALARSATSPYARIDQGAVVSIHALARSATVLLL